MPKRLLPLIPAGLLVQQILPASDRLTIVTAPRSASAACPDCCTPSSRVHSRYERVLDDLPWQGRPVSLRIRVRRFRCASSDCSRLTFAERLEGTALAAARRTGRLGDLQHHLGLALGGDGLVAYNRGLLDLARHFGFQPRACRPYRPKTKGKVERPFHYVREDFFLARSFRNLDDLNLQLRQWLDTVANARVHATTRQVVNESFAREKPALTPLPLVPYRAVLRLERRISHEGMIRVGGNAYSVPDTVRRRVLEVHSMVDEIRIFESGVLIASHAPLPGRHQVHIDPAHRQARARTSNQPGTPPSVPHRAGDVVARRSLDFYDALGRVLAAKGHA